MNKIKPVIYLCLTLSVIYTTSYFSVKLWSEKREEIDHRQELVISGDMTLDEVKIQNNLPIEVLKKVFNLTAKTQLSSPLSEFSDDIKKTEAALLKSLAIYEEHATKNWFKIPLKFVIWFIFMGLMFFMLKKGKLNSNKRRIAYLLSFTIFGIILGADPAPMGTVKDAIALFGEKQVIFKPRMVAMTVFLLTVFLANKMICSWGCQFGTLQDFIFRLNKDKTTGFKQVKIPFVVTNSIRIIFFICFTSLAFIIPFDIISEIDPFKIYKPQYLTLLGALFISLLCVSSLFIYRPWCHLFCPFGLTSWIIEQFSWIKIRVNSHKCTNCGACAKNCPSTSMQAILGNKNIKPDCFSCGSCIEACSNNAVSYTTKFKKETK